MAGIDGTLGVVLWVFVMIVLMDIHVLIMVWPVMLWNVLNNYGSGQWFFSVWVILEPQHYITHFLTGQILGLCPANERRRYKVTASFIGWVQT